MKMKLSEIISKYNSITGLKDGKMNPNAILNKTFPAKLEYGISKNVKKFEDEIASYNKEREKICKELCEKDKDGNPVMENEGKSYKLDEEAKKTLDKELNDLLDAEVEIEIHMVPESVLDQCMSSERYHVPSTREVLILLFMLEDGE